MVRFRVRVRVRVMVMVMVMVMVRVRLSLEVGPGVLWVNVPSERQLELDEASEFGSGS